MSPNKNPLVSILIPCYNAESWIEQAIESALAQKNVHAEVIVVDDGSTDESVTKALAFGDRIRLEAGPNKGSNPTRNRLLELAAGKWIQYLDSDDYLLPNKIRNQLDALGDGDLIDAVYGPVRVEYISDGKIIGTEVICRGAMEDDPWAKHLSWNLTQIGGLLVKRSALETIGGWDESLFCCQDNDLFMRLLMNENKFLYCDDVGAVYRRFESNTVSTGDPLQVKCQMLNLLERSRDYLITQGIWTSERKDTMDQYRFTLARQMWGIHRDWSEQLEKTIRTESPGFCPEPGTHVPLLYPKLYRYFGFRWSERIAAAKRAFI